MKVLVTGSTGMIGAALVPALIAHGHSVGCLVRPQSKAIHPACSILTWDPKEGWLDPGVLEGFDALIHLAGENLASGRWTQEKKDLLQKSRTHSTTLLSEGLAGLAKKPEVFISASAIGFYGNRGNEELKEQSSQGKGFLAELCTYWESATTRARTAGIRVVNLRTGVVLDTHGGALAKMLLPFQLGIGGQIGNGKQFLSWISIDDEVGAILHALHTPTLAGPVNLTAPNPVTNSQFTKALGKVLSRPTLLPIPGFALTLLFGEMADECLIAGQKVIPQKLLDSSYQFRDREIEPALRRILGK